MLLKEDIFENEIFDAEIPDTYNVDIDVTEIDSEVPQAGPEVGISTLIMNSIASTYSMIEDYNSLSIALTDIGNESATVAIADVIKMEHANIGVLQDILKEISPNAEAVDINESLNESYESKFRDIVNYLKAVFPEGTHWSYDDYRAIPDDLGGGMRFQVEFDSNDSSLQSKIINALKEKYCGITCSNGWGSDWDYYISIKIDEEFC